MKLLPEDLDTYIRNYQRYLGAIKRLDLEIEAKEAEINRLPGSIIRKPDGTNKAPTTTTRQVQLLWELDQLMQDREGYQNRIELVDRCLAVLGQTTGFDLGYHIALSRRDGLNFYRIEQDLGLSSKRAKNKYWRALDSYCKFGSKNVK